MAISTNDYSQLEKEDKGLLEVSASDFYFDKVRPYMQDMLLTCRTDEELLRTIDKIINSGDSYCIRKEYKLLIQSFDTFNKAVNNRDYFSGVIKQAPEEEKEKIRKLIELVNDLALIVQCEKPNIPVESQPKERIDYNPPTGGNKGEGYNSTHLEHNMKNLSEPILKQRIPNV